MGETDEYISETRARPSQKSIFVNRQYAISSILRDWHREKDLGIRSVEIGRDRPRIRNIFIIIGEAKRQRKKQRKE